MNCRANTETPLPALDFSGIFPALEKKNAEKQAAEARNDTRPYENIRKDENGLNGFIEPSIAKLCYMSFSEAIKKAENGKSRILKAIKQGAAPTTLFSEAVKLIGMLTDDISFSEQCTEEAATIYGQALGEPATLQAEITQARQRIARMTACRNTSKDGNTRRRLDAAIKEHQALIADLERRAAGESLQA